MKKIEIVTLPGDGIGPEVTAVALHVLQKACKKYGVEIDATERDFGGISFEKHGTPVTDKTIELCKQKKVVLLGAVGGPQWDNLDANLRPEAALLKLRKELGVFANLRPIRVYESLADSSSLKYDVVSGTDILIVRELTGGVYFGKPRVTSEKDGDPYSLDTMKYSRSEVARVAREAFEAARLRNKKLCSVDKANVLESSRMWRKTVLEVAKEYPDVELTHMLVDNCAMQLVRNPKQFDVMVTGNLFGDILSDEASMITGSLGMLPSASLGSGNGLYEPVHGSAPDISGQGVANPLAAVASAAMMARFSLDLPGAAMDIENAISHFLDSGNRTADITSDEDDIQVRNTAETQTLLLSYISDQVAVSP